MPVFLSSPSNMNLGLYLIINLTSSLRNPYWLIKFSSAAAMSLSTSKLLRAFGILDGLIPGYLYLSFLINRSSSDVAEDSTSSEMISAAPSSLLVAVCVEKVLRVDRLFARLFVLNLAY